MSIKLTLQHFGYLAILFSICFFYFGFRTYACMYEKKYPPSINYYKYKVKSNCQDDMGVNELVEMLNKYQTGYFDSEIKYNLTFFLYLVYF